MMAGVCTDDFERSKNMENNVRGTCGTTTVEITTNGVTVTGDELIVSAKRRLKMMSEKEMQEFEAGRKRFVLKSLMETLYRAGVRVDLKLDPDKELVYVFFEGHETPVVVNIAMDNCVAMLVDIFKQAGGQMIARV